MRVERSWENTEPAGIPDGQHPACQRGLIQRTAAKNSTGPSSIFYRYILQVSRLSRAANGGRKPGKQYCSLAPPSAAGDGLFVGSAPLPWPGDTAGDTQSRGTAPTCPEGQTPVALCRAEPLQSPGCKPGGQKLLTGNTGWPGHCKLGAFCGILLQQCRAVAVPRGGSSASLRWWVDVHP